MSRILGFGELVADILLVEEGGRIATKQIRGGGPLCNCLANISASGIPTQAYVSAGDDVLSQIAEEDLASLGVKVITHSSRNKYTRRIFIECKNTLFGVGAKVSPPTTTCPNCRRQLESHELAPTFLEHWNTTIGTLEHGDIVVFDRLRDAVADAAKMARARGAFSFLDIGTGTYLRYASKHDLKSWVSEFDLIQAPYVLFKKLAGDQELKEFFRPRLALVCTRGAEGLTIIAGSEVEGEQVVDLLPPNVEIVADATGAGDALLAGVIARCQDIAAEKESQVDKFRLIVQYYRESIKECLPSVLTSIGARGHLPSSSISGGAMVCNSSDECCSCLLPVDQEQTARRVRKSEFVATANLRNLAVRVRHAIGRREVSGKAAELIETVDREEGICYVIGTGGSFPPANYISAVISRHTRGIGVAVHPWDYIKLGKESATVIIVSYSGGSGDVEAVVRAARLKSAKRIILVTGRATLPRRPSVFQEFDTILAYGRRSESGEPFPGKERGFISIAATVSPAAIFASVPYGEEMVINCIERAAHRSSLINVAANALAQASREGQVIHVIGGGWSWAAMLDLEGKMTETDLAHIQLHETRDFSHGRFMSVLARNNAERGEQRDSPVLLFSSGEIGRYESRLRMALSERSICDLSPSDENGLGGLESLSLVQHISIECGRILGTDISKPRNIPKAGLDLYRWRPEVAF